MCIGDGETGVSKSLKLKLLVPLRVLRLKYDGYRQRFEVVKVCILDERYIRRQTSIGTGGRDVDIWALHGTAKFLLILEAYTL